MTGPEIKVELNPYLYGDLYIESSNVSDLALICVNKTASDRFRGEPVTNNVIGAVECYIKRILNSLIQMGILMRPNYRSSKYEVCGWIPDADPKDYYRYFLLGCNTKE